MALSRPVTDHPRWRVFLVACRFVKWDSDTLIKVIIASIVVIIALFGLFLAASLLFYL